MGILDEVPPNNITAEQQVLSSILLNRDVMQNLIADISEDWFYHAKHNQIFAAIKKHQTIDIAQLSIHVPDSVETISEILELGAFRDCSESVSTLRDMFVRRQVRSELIRALLSVQSDFEVQAADQINQIYDKLFQLSSSGQKFEPQLIGDLLPQFFTDIELQQKNGIASRSIITGLPTVDENLFIEPGDLVVLGARPSMGKSTLSSCIARYNAVKRGKSVAYFSVEMGGRTQVKRDVFSEADCNLFAFNKGIMPMRDYPKLSIAAGALSDAKLWIDSEPGITPMKIRSKCNFIKSKTGLDLIVVDYLQICNSDKNIADPRQKISDITQGFKDIAKYFDVPFIALSQLSRSLESRPNKRPMKSDLMESGAIEAIADIILFLYRDEVYNHNTEDKNIAELICAKQRNGMADFYKRIYFKRDSMNFTELSSMGADSGCDRF